MEPVWIGSPSDIRYGSRAEQALNVRNDSKYWTDEFGIVKIDDARWQEAQEYERIGWSKNWVNHSDDRSEEHRSLLDGYSVVPSTLGHVVEFGCGPFTQVRTISQTRSLLSIDLIDPLIYDYVRLPNCAYRSGMLCGVIPAMIQMRAEQADFISRYDTAISINVLEHAQDVWEVLDNIHTSLKTGGTIIFGERTYDSLDIKKVFDIGHPIRIKKAVVDRFKSLFHIKYECGIEGFEGYFIGTKK